MTAKVSRPRFEVDRQNALDLRAFIFTRKDSLIDAAPQDINDMILAGYLPKGFWSKPPEWMQDYSMPLGGKVYAFVSCPKCSKVSMITDSVTKCDILGHLTPDFTCVHLVGGVKCGYRKIAYLDNWNDRVLYACSFYNRKGEIEIHYTHGNSPAMARAELGASCRDQDIIAIGPAIGFFVDEKADKEGRILTAN